jgi:hypothetical protein
MFFISTTLTYGIPFGEKISPFGKRLPPVTDAIYFNSLTSFHFNISSSSLINSGL